MTTTLWQHLTEEQRTALLDKAITTFEDTSAQWHITSLGRDREGDYFRLHQMPSRAFDPALARMHTEVRHYDVSGRDAAIGIKMRLVMEAVLEAVLTHRQSVIRR